MSHGTNNPFASTSSQSAVEATASRFPDVSQDPALAAYGQQQQFAQPQYQQQQQPVYQNQQQFQQPQFQQQQPTGFSGGAFQPQSFTGQQISAQVTGIQQGQGYGGASPFQQGGGYGQQYPPQYAQAPQPQTFVSDLDPYGAVGALQNVGGQGQGRQQVPQGLSASNASSQPEAHPRTFVQSHRNELSQWDEYSWKQLLNRVDGLREAWEARKAAVLNVSGQGGDPGLIEGLRKQAESNVDSIHASKLQISEVQAGWRHSTDLGSKARVREALNAGLNSLPDFPTALAPEQLGGIFAQRATEDYRKNAILQNFNTPQQQGLVPLYAQPTGYPGAGGGGGYMQPQATGYPQQFVQQQPTGFYQGGGGGYQQQQYY